MTRTRLLPPMLLAVLTALAYSNAAPQAFVYDDFAVIAQNPHLGGVARIPQLFGQRVREGQAGIRLYRPLSMATLTVDGSLYGTRPRGYHVTSIVLHVSITLVLYGLLSALGTGGFASFFAALIFGVHPIHTEVVDLAFNRSEIMATLFVVGGLWWLWSWVERRPVAAYSGAAVFYLAGLLSRESAATFPLLAAIALLFLKTAIPLRARVRLALPVLALALPLCLYLWLRQHALGATAGGLADSILKEGVFNAPGLRLPVVISTLRDYLRMLVWPWPLQASYDGYAAHSVSLAVGFHVVLIVLAALTRSRFPALGFGVAFFYAAILPSTKLVADPAVFAERFLYLPSAGAAVTLAFGLLALSKRFGARAVGAVGGVLVIVLSSLTLYRNTHWHSAQALWEAEIRTSPRDWRALLNLSQVYIDMGKPSDALALCDRGISIEPSRSGFHANRGIALIGLGRAAESEESFKRAVELSGSPDDHANLARLYVFTGRPGQAEEPYGRAAEGEQDAAKRHLLLGERLLHCRGDLPGARAEFEAALALAPRLRMARQGLELVKGLERAKQR